MNWYLDVLKKYAVADGRARRKEYWMFVLFNVIISLVLQGLDAVAKTNGILAGAYGLGVLAPSICVGIRRLHDTNRSGWWWLIIFVPLVGAIMLIVFFATEGTSGDNQYGSNPKGMTSV